jgi:integrase
MIAAEWTEFDLEADEWNITARRMKTREPHLVPLSVQAIAILRELLPLTGSGRYLFPCLRDPARPMSENALNGALRRRMMQAWANYLDGLKAGAEVVPLHGRLA